MIMSTSNYFIIIWIGIYIDQDKSDHEHLMFHFSHIHTFQGKMCTRGAQKLTKVWPFHQVQIFNLIGL